MCKSFSVLNLVMCKSFSVQKLVVCKSLLIVKASLRKNLLCVKALFVQTLFHKVVLGRTLCKLCSTKKYWETLCASFVVQSSTGKCFAQALQYKVVLGASFVYYKVLLGSVLCKLCSTK